MKRLAVFAACLAAMPAHALSCLPPDAVRLYRQADESKSVYAIVIGRLQPEGEIAVPEAQADGTTGGDRTATTRVRMSGRVLGEFTFDQEFDIMVDVKVRCLSIWCGAAPVDREILAALRVGGEVPELEIGPCGGLAMTAADADIDALTECHRTGRCSDN